MTSVHPHHDRTVRLLEARLEALAHSSEHSLAGPQAVDRHVVALTAATVNAVELELLSAEEAREIWIGVAERHPAARWCLRPPVLAA